MVLNDFLRGKIPWFTPPPAAETDGDDGIDGREGRLGEMKKRKREDAESVADTSMGAPTPPPGGDDAASDDEFEGFGSGSEPDAASDSDSDSDSEVGDVKGGVALESASTAEDIIQLDISSEDDSNDDSVEYAEGGDSDKEGDEESKSSEAEDESSRKRTPSSRRSRAKRR
jgi:nuclear GTP-binding protein